MFSALILIVDSTINLISEIYCHMRVGALFQNKWIITLYVEVMEWLHIHFFLIKNLLIAWPMVQEILELSNGKSNKQNLVIKKKKKTSKTTSLSLPNWNRIKHKSCCNLIILRIIENSYRTIHTYIHTCVYIYLIHPKNIIYINIYFFS